MRRYFLGEPVLLETGHIFQIEKDVYHHVVKVCRHQNGEKFELLDGLGHAVLVELTQVGKKSAFVKVIEFRKLPLCQPPFIHLCVAFPKFSTLEWILEKSVEMGIHSVVPMFTDFSFIGSSKKISESKWNRFGKIIQAATEQCGRADLLELAEPAVFAQAVAGAEKTGGKLIMASLSDTNGALGFEGTSDIYLFVGSEGGFSPTEIQGFPGEKVSLGELTLRCETACIYLTAVVQSQLHLAKVQP